VPIKLPLSPVYSLRFFPFQPPSPDLNLKGWWMAIDEVINRGGGGSGNDAREGEIGRQ